MLEATEMDLWRRSASISRRNRTQNETAWEIMDAKQIIVHDIMIKQLIWYGHDMRLTKLRLPKRVLDWVSPGRRRIRRPTRGLRNGIAFKVASA